MRKSTEAALGLLLVGAVWVSVSAQAGVAFTIEGPGVQATTVAGAITETFDSLPVGPVGTYVSPIGTFNGGAVVPGSYSGGAFGGAYGSDYYAVGLQSGTVQGTLTFAKPEYYFGMWWPAGDAGNELEFYDGSTLLASYRVANIIPSLSPAYFGNPNNGLDSGEPFVYLDFTATGSDQFTKVVFNNDTVYSGYEMDNMSVYGQPITPPGNPVPDPASTLALLGFAVTALAGLRRKL